MRHAVVLRARALTAHDQYFPRAVLGPHRAAAALSHRNRGAAGVDLYRRAAGAAEGLSRRGLAALEEEASRCCRGSVRTRSRGCVSARPTSSIWFSDAGREGAISSVVASALEAGVPFAPLSPRASLRRSRCRA